MVTLHQMLVEATIMWIPSFAKELGALFLPRNYRRILIDLYASVIGLTNFLGYAYAATYYILFGFGLGPFTCWTAGLVYKYFNQWYYFVGFVDDVAFGS